MAPDDEHDCAWKHEALSLRGELGALKQRMEQLEASMQRVGKKAVDDKKRQETTPGDKSEKLKSVTTSKPRKPQQGHGPTAQPALPEVDGAVQKLDAADCICPDCAGRLEEWPGQFEESEEIDVVVSSYVRKKNRGQKYKCCKCTHIESPLAAPKVLPGGRYSNEFVLQVVVQKYLDHCPLERQVRTMSRTGLIVTSQTLWDQQWALYALLKGLKPRLREYALRKWVLGVDETRWPFLGEDPRNWTLWCATAADVVYIEILDGRGSEQGQILLKDFRGILVVDGYAVYEWLSKTYPDITLAFCWAHVRRHFRDVEKAFPQEVKRLLDLVSQLFKIDSEATSKDHLLVLRKARSQLIVDEIKNFITTTAALPESGLRKAMEYVAKRWTGLTRFMENADIPLSNNQTERAQRGPVVGRKSHGGSHSERGTESAALFYSLFETAKLCRINPEAYLRLAMNEALAGNPVPLPHEVRHHPDLVMPANSG